MKKKDKEKIKNISKSIDIVMNNRLTIAIFVIVDGINFIINPYTSLEFMARIIVGLAFIAAGTIIVTEIKTKKNELKSIIPAIIMMIICLYFLIYPKFFAQNLRVLSALFIIFNGFINIFNIIKLDKICSSINYTENHIKDKFDKEEDNKKFNKKIILEQTEKIANPITSAIKHSSNNTVLYFILNIVSIFLGIVLFINDDITIIVCGIILVYSGIFDALMYIKSLQLSNKMKKLDQNQLDLDNK